jgi:hypothetical protein
VENAFNNGERIQAKLRPGRSAIALKIANAAGVTLCAAEAPHRVFCEHDWQVPIDFEKE